MKIEGKEIPHREYGGPEWLKAMRALDEDTLIQMLRTKGIECDRYHDVASKKCGEHMVLSSRLDRATECNTEQTEAMTKDKGVRDGLIVTLKDIASTDALFVGRRGEAGAIDAMIGRAKEGLKAAGEKV